MSKPPIDVRLIDHAKNILQAYPLPQELKARAWDAWHDSRTVAELKPKLAALHIPNEHIVQALLLAKRACEPEPEPMNSVLEVLNYMAKMPREVLDRVEKHKNVLNHFLHFLGD